MVRVSPTTHISSLANLHRAFCIQMLSPVDLYYSLDWSTDLEDWAKRYRPVGHRPNMDTDFADLLDHKYQNCSEWYKTNLANLGVQEPIVIIVRGDNGWWQMDEGHHRLSWSLRHRVPLVPVIFDDSGADDDSHMGFLVARANVDAYHNTATEEFLMPQAAEMLVAETDEYLAQQTVFIPTPRAGRHRNGGRHRAPTD
jgi:hypothetical protein